MINPLSAEYAQRRLRSIAAINRRVKPPSPEDLRILKDQHHCETWGEYLVTLAEGCGVSASTAFTAFEMLGPSEAFDGLVTTLEDESYLGGE